MSSPKLPLKLQKILEERERVVLNLAGHAIQVVSRQHIRQRRDLDIPTDELEKEARYLVLRGFTDELGKHPGLMTSSAAALEEVPDRMVSDFDWHPGLIFEMRAVVISPKRLRELLEAAFDKGLEAA